MVVGTGLICTMRYDAPQLLVVGTRSQHALRACAGFDLIWLDLISIRALLTPRYGVFAQQNPSCWKVPVCGAEDVD